MASLRKLAADVKTRGTEDAAAFPQLVVACSISPPFRPLTADEDAADAALINQSGVRILFVGIGCPKQELWMAAHKDRLSCVMIGVGAAFDFFSGRQMHAPSNRPLWIL